MIRGKNQNWQIINCHDFNDRCHFFYDKNPVILFPENGIFWVK